MKLTNKTVLLLVLIFFSLYVNVEVSQFLKDSAGYPTMILGLIIGVAFILIYKKKNKIFIFTK